MEPISRRTLLRASAVAGAAMFIRVDGQAVAIPVAQAAPLNVAGVGKYVSQLFIPPAMPPTATSSLLDQYTISARQVMQQILPSGLPATKVWGYGSNPAMTHSSPSFTVEARANRAVQVTWVNGLKDASGRFLPHLLPVDPTLHWANPPGGLSGRDSMPEFTSTPGPYTGPVPLSTHLHGAHVGDESDGFPEAWYLPAATDIPSGYAKVGSMWDAFSTKFQSQFGGVWQPGTAVARYPNDQAATTLWFHDHTLGMTHANVYSGLQGFYLIRGGPFDLPTGVLPGPAPAVGDASGKRYYEIPLIIQDRRFNADGSLFYPDSRAFFDGFTGPYVPDSDIAPIFNPETFGDTMLVNGQTWPNLNVERRRYRFRILNASNSRFVILKVASNATAKRPAKAALPMWQVGSDGGFLTKPAQVDQILVAPAERADVIVDFTNVRAGTQLFLINEGPDEPFGGGVAGRDFAAADPASTGQVMRFTVVNRVGTDTSTPPGQLTSLPAEPKPPASTVTRSVSLSEADSEVLDGVGPRAAFLGTTSNGQAVPLGWHDPVTENPAVGATETWEIVNTTEDAHPIHLHLVQFQILNRQPFGGSARGPEPTESGLKDMVIAYPGETTRLRATFDKAGLYVWHCHIVEHEDNEMMRPYRVGP